MSATAPVNTPEKPRGFVTAPVAAATTIFAGSLVAINAAGFAVPAADAADLKVVGRAEADADNSAGAAGDISVTIKRGVFQFANSGAAPVVAADLLTVVFVADDMTVRTDGGVNSIKAGVCVGLDADGVWVDTTLAAAV